MTGALLTALLSAALAALGGFTTGVALRAHDSRREKRVSIYLDDLPACLSAIGDYASCVRREGPLASMAFDDVIVRMRILHRAAMVASRQDEAHVRVLAWAAADLARALARHDDVEGLPRRQREGGWAKLAWDTISQVEVALLEYQLWLERRLLGPRPARQATHYESIEINRDLDGEDLSRFSRPRELSTDVLSNLLRVPIISWAVLTGLPIGGRVLVIWIRDPDQRIMQCFSETDDDWLRPIGNVPDPDFPETWRIAAYLPPEVAAPTERETDSPTMVIAEFPVPPVVRAELAADRAHSPRPGASDGHSDGPA